MKKTFIQSAALLILSALAFASCETEENTAKPVIDLTEVGLQNSKTATIGSDLHLAAEILAEGRIHTLTVELHAEDNSDHSLDTIYTEFAGLKNTSFHKHIDIPTDFTPGDYHLHLIVTDQQGQQSVAESELSLQLPSDAVAPIVQITSHPIENQSYGMGQHIQLSGIVTDNLSLGGLYIGLVKADQGLDDASVNASNTITLLHTHSFSSTTSHTFNASIEVGTTTDNDMTSKAIEWTSGNYYIVVKCKDTYGANWTYSAHYPIQVTI